MSPTWYFSRKGPLWSPDATFAERLLRWVLRCSEQDRGTASVCASGGCYKKQGRSRAEGWMERDSPCFPSYQRCCHTCPCRVWELLMLFGHV